ncbi:MAG: Mu-like prophage major head subunit gpT family protein [Zoogloeaceae bacterium]|jgi:phage major head subunit gpT-like protein|nr:Mu-like prophage major head subunit gpT family protein [Zoogloeaceae bacterium]
MPITQQQLDALKTSIVARFNAGLAAAPDDWTKIARLIPSSSKSNTYAWLSQFPAFREWVGARAHKALAEKAYTVVNKKFEATVDVQRTDIEDDAFDHYGAIAESAGRSAIDHKNSLIFEALKAGFTSECYDGQYFFDADHPVYANEDGTGGVTTVSNLVPLDTDGEEEASEPWALLCTKRAVAPLYLQERVPVEFAANTAVWSDNVFNLDVYSYGARWRGNAAYGFWQCAVGSQAVLTVENFEKAYNTMMKFTGDGGRILGLIPDLLVVGPDKMADAERLLKTQFNPDGGSNIHYQKVDLLVTPWMK